MYTGIVYDVMRSHDVTECVLPAPIRPLAPGQKAAGPAYTVAGNPTPGLTAHASLLAWTEFLSAVPAGSVVVCQPNDGHLAHMGELSAETLQYRGVRGFVVDGGCRDTRFIVDADFPVWCRYQTPIDIVGRWRADTLGEPVVVGKVEVSTGDMILADDDGVVVIPAEAADDVISEARQLASTENLVRKAILEGVPPKDAYVRYGKF